MKQSAGLTDEAIRWLKRAAAGGDSDALLQLGLRSMSGNGMPQDKAQGAEFFRRSAERGNVLAAYNLGVYYEHDERGFLGLTDWRSLAFGAAADQPPESLVNAFKWYQRAAEAGYAPAQVRMGDFFITGRVVDRDVSAAREWYNQAAAQQHKEAGKKLAALEDESSTE